MKYIILLASLIWPSLAFAQQQAAFSPLTLTPPPTDLSLNYLSNIFGTVDGVLVGNASQLLGSLFGVFNSAVLVLGGIVIIYTLFVSTLNTAHEGEVLGKAWSSVWIPVRSVAGIALLIPKASGYSFVQIFMMWVVVQGIGAADSIWGATLDYLTRGGIVIAQNSAPGKTAQSRAMINNAGTLLRSLTCTYMLEQQFINYRQAQVSNGQSPINTPPDFYQGIVGAFSANSGGSGSISFPNSGYYGTDGVCGSVSWAGVQLPAFMMDNGVVKQQYVSIQTAIQQSRTLAVQQMVTTLFPSAEAIVNNYVSTTPIPLGEIIPNSNPVLWGFGTPSNPGPNLLPGTILSSAAVAYSGAMAATLNLINNNVNANSGDWMNQSRTTGWILAGSYYYKLVSLNNAVGSLTDTNAPTFAGPQPNLATMPAVYNYLGGKNSSYVNAVSDIVTNNASLFTVGTTSPFITGATTYGASLQYGNAGTMTAYSTSGAGSQVLALLLGGLSSIIGGFYDLQNAQQTNANPILALAMLGSGIISIAIELFIAIAFLLFALAIGLGFAFGFDFSIGVVALAIPLFGLLTPVLLGLIGAGFTMAYYIPIIPYIVFTLGAIGWFISVVEAVIAAPLVALGIAHPEGHAILGKAEPAVVLLVNVFLRPTLMIFGLLVGMMLSYVSIWLLNAGFSSAYSGYSGSVQGIAAAFAPLASLVLYIIIVQQLVQKSFTLIYVIPDEVLKWIGGNIKGMGGEEAGEAKIAAAHKAAGEAGAQTVEKAGQGAMEKGFGAGKSIGGGIDKGLTGGGEGGDVGASGLSGGEKGEGGIEQGGGTPKASVTPSSDKGQGPSGG